MVTSDREDIHFWIVWVSAVWHARRCAVLSTLKVVRIAGRCQFRGSGGGAVARLIGKVALWLFLMAAMRVIPASWRESLVVLGALHTGAGAVSTGTWHQYELHLLAHLDKNTCVKSQPLNSNNNNTIWRGSVLTGEELPPHSEKLNHALSQVGGPNQFQLSRPMSSRHHISMEHRQRRTHLLLNPNSNAGSAVYSEKKK